MKSYGHFSGILAYFSQFYHDLSLIILKSRDYGCQFSKIINFTCFYIVYFSIGDISVLINSETVLCYLSVSRTAKTVM